MKLFFSGLFAFFIVAGFSSALLTAQINSTTPAPSTKTPVSAANASGSTISRRASSAVNLTSEMGGAFMSPSKCDADGNLYIRKLAMDRPLLGPVVKIDADGKRTALFDPAAFSKLALDRADAFSPAADGGMYQIAQSGVLKPLSYVLRFSSDGSPSSPTRIDADFEVYTFAAFASGNFLVSGVQREVQNRNDRGRNFTAVFSADGRELAQVSFQEAQGPAKAGAKSVAGGGQQGAQKEAEKSAPMLDLADA